MALISVFPLVFPTMCSHISFLALRIQRCSEGVETRKQTTKNLGVRVRPGFNRPCLRCLLEWIGRSSFLPLCDATGGGIILVVLTRHRASAFQSCFCCLVFRLVSVFSPLVWQRRFELSGRKSVTLPAWRRRQLRDDRDLFEEANLC